MSAYLQVIREGIESGKPLPELDRREQFVLMLALAERAAVPTIEEDGHETLSEITQEAHALLERIAKHFGWK